MKTEKTITKHCCDLQGNPIGVNHGWNKKEDEIWREKIMERMKSKEVKKDNKYLQIKESWDYLSNIDAYTGDPCDLLIKFLLANTIPNYGNGTDGDYFDIAEEAIQIENEILKENGLDEIEFESWWSDLCHAVSHASYLRAIENLSKILGIKQDILVKLISYNIDYIIKNNQFNFNYKEELKNEIVKCINKYESDD
jgi:hypothetical protein